MSGARSKMVSVAFVLTVMTVMSVLAPTIVGLGDAEASAAGGVSSPMNVTEYPYRDFAEVVEVLEETAAAHPGIARLVDIGDGWEKTQGIADRDILAMRITDNPDIEEGEPDVLFMARQHANEPTPTEIALQLIENLTDLYGSDTRISWLVDNRDIWIIPVVNPDGMDYFTDTGENWRKNRHLNYDGSYGVDLNRNYAGSENGDPLGEWSVGASLVPSDVDYCGEYAFSEPETQAVRDLALDQRFEVAIDFHMSGDVICWPWGYTTNATPDDDDFTRIGSELSKLNGYLAAQSYVTGLLAGDSVDWLYGGGGAYSFLFEVGGWLDYFHPDDQYGIVQEQIAENIPPALLLAEIAGDRSELRFDIDHHPLDDSSYSETGFEVSARITAERDVDQGAQLLRYRVDGGDWTELTMVAANAMGVYTAIIPSAAAGSVIDYYIVAHDNGGVELMSPMYAPYEVHSFQVLSTG